MKKNILPRYFENTVWRTKRRFDRTVYRIDKKLHPECILTGTSVVVIPQKLGDDNEMISYDGNDVFLKLDNEKVKHYEDVSFIRTVGLISINNIGGTWNVWSFSLKDEEWGEVLPIYTFYHDSTLYISNEPDLILKTIELECDHHCVIKAKVVSY